MINFLKSMLMRDVKPELVGRGKKKISRTSYWVRSNSLKEGKEASVQVVRSAYLFLTVHQEGGTGLRVLKGMEEIQSRVG